jgi:hypothetical protein
VEVPLTHPFDANKMGRARRNLAITGGLAIFGAAAGAIAGALVAVLAISLSLGPLEALDLELLGFGATLGAPLGAVLLPISGWLLMRRVPLGRAMLGTMLGAIAGGLMGWFAPLHIDVLDRALFGAFVGFATAVIALRQLGSRSASAADHVPLA